MVDASRSQEQPKARLEVRDDCIIVAGFEDGPVDRCFADEVEIENREDDSIYVYGHNWNHAEVLYGVFRRAKDGWIVRLSGVDVFPWSYTLPMRRQ